MTTEIKYGLNINGKIRVFRKDKEIQGKGKKTFTINDVWFNVSEQEENGEYFNKSMNMIFKKGLELPANNSVIIIKDAFPMITGNEQYRKIALYVGAWEPAAGGDPKQQKEKPPETNGSGPIEVTDDDLPF